LTAARPKPSYDGGKKPPYGQFLDWLDRMVGSTLGDTYANLAAMAAAITAAATTASSAAAAAIAAQSTANTHASRHIHGGADVVDGDRLDVDYVPTNYTRNPGSNGTVDNDELTSHLEGIDDALASFTAAKTTMFMGSTNQLGTAASTTYYHHVSGYFEDPSPVTAIEEKAMIWGRAGTIKNLRYQNMESVADSDTYSWTLNKNGSDTTLTITGISPANTTLLGDTTHTVTVAVGDVLVFKQVNGANTLTGNCNPSWTFDFVEA
jgi:hypothetical protein